VSHLAALAAFLGFLALGARVRWSPPPARRRRVQALVAYVLGAHALAVALTWDAWPFTSHTIAVGRVRGEAPLCTTEAFGVDAGGREWRVDPYAFMPVYDSVLQYWWDTRGVPLPLWAQHHALRFLGTQAEAARAAQARGDRIGPARALGPLGAPYWLLLPRPAAVSPEPYLGLRLYRVCGLPRDRAAEPSRVTRELSAEWRQP
jgi:hypothetical protein